jgi:hypothetical protein
MSEILYNIREGYSPKQIKMAIGIASDKRYAGGNMTGAVNAIEKIKKGLSDHPQVAAVLKRQNEDIQEDGHTDVASAKNQVKVAMTALQKMEMELGKLNDEDSLPSWWTNKVAIAVDKIDGMADYLDTQVEGVEPIQWPSQPLEESVTIDELKMDDPKLNKVFDKLKRGDTVKLKTSSTISKGTDFVDYVVKSKNTVNKGRVEKITLVTKGNEKAVKKFLYKRDGKVTFAIGDMGASIDDIKEGTWALPDSPKAKAELKKLMSKPIKLGKEGDDAADKLYALIGDDELFDDLYVAGKKNPNGDARDVVKKHMKRLGIKEEVELDESKSATGYEIFHKDFSSAMQHATAFAKSKGQPIKKDEIDNKVATGPKKPSKGKENSYTLETEKGKRWSVQVYNMGNKFELNMYLTSSHVPEGDMLDEAVKYQFVAIDRLGKVIGFASDEGDAKDMARRGHTMDSPSKGKGVVGRNKAKVVKLKKPMSDKQGDMMINRDFDMNKFGGETTYSIGLGEETELDEAPKMKYALVGTDMKIYSMGSDERDLRLDRKSLEKRFKDVAPLKMARLKTAQSIGDKVDKSQLKEEEGEPQKPDTAKAVDQMRDDKKKTRIAQLQLQIAKAQETINKLNAQEKPNG